MNQDLEFHVLELTDEQICVVRDLLEYAMSKNSKIKYGDIGCKDVHYLVQEAINTTEQYRIMDDPTYETMEARSLRELDEFLKQPQTDKIQ